MAPEPFTDSTLHAGHVIARLARSIERSLASVDLTLSQYRMLGLLGDGSEAASTLADRLAVSRPSVTGVVDGLVARGLVRRDHLGDDRRRVDLGLTDDGRLVLAAADLEVEQRLADIASRLDGGADAAFEGLQPWREALLAREAARRAGGSKQEEDRVNA